MNLGGSRSYTLEGLQHCVFWTACVSESSSTVNLFFQGPHMKLKHIPRSPVGGVFHLFFSVLFFSKASGPASSSTLYLDVLPSKNELECVNYQKTNLICTSRCTLCIRDPGLPVKVTHVRIYRASVVQTIRSRKEDTRPPLP